MSATCKVCDGGQMTQTKISRMSTPVIVIGYILLIPSVLFVLLFGGCTILGSIGSGSAVAQAAEEVTMLHDEAVVILTDVGYSDGEAETILANESDVYGDIYGVVDDSKYTEVQSNAITSALAKESESMMTAAGAGIGTAAAGFGAIIGIILTIGAFVSGLVGWLLIMKKKVLKCGSCSAIVDAA